MNEIKQAKQLKGAVMAGIINVVINGAEQNLLLKKKVKFFPTAFWLTIKHGFFTFGILTSLAVLWQRYMGTVEVSLVTALIIIGVIAGLVSGIVNYLTLKESTMVEKTKRGQA